MQKPAKTLGCRDCTQPQPSISQQDFCGKDGKKHHVRILYAINNHVLVMPK